MASTLDCVVPLPPEEENTTEYSRMVYRARPQHQAGQLVSSTDHGPAASANIVNPFTDEFARTLWQQEQVG
jgi:hypothetical protein